MLVLSREIGQEIVIGDNIHVTVLSFHGNTVRIGITAPKGVVVYRQEVHERRTPLVNDGALLRPPVPILVTKIIKDVATEVN
jgi:carbon storage regulator